MLKLVNGNLRNMITITATFGFSRGQFFWRLHQVRPGPLKVFQRRISADCCCEIFLQARCPSVTQTTMSMQ